MSGFWLISYIALWVILLVVAVVLLSVLRHLGTIYETLAAYERLAPPPTNMAVGDVAPDVELATLDGLTAPVSQFRGAKTAFVIVSPACSPCGELLSDLAATGSSVYSPDPTIQQRVVISTGDRVETAAVIASVGLGDGLPVLLDSEGKLWAAWGIGGTPTMVIVDEQLRLVSQQVGYDVPRSQDANNAALIAQ